MKTSDYLTSISVVPKDKSSENRLQMARTAIYTKEKTITEIAYELGFSHSQHFHRAFKKRFGETPKSLVKN